MVLHRAEVVLDFGSERCINWLLGGNIDRIDARPEGHRGGIGFASNMPGDGIHRNPSDGQIDTCPFESPLEDVPLPGLDAAVPTVQLRDHRSPGARIGIHGRHRLT